MVSVLDPVTVTTMEVRGGLAGLEGETEYRLLMSAEDPVYWLESVRTPHIALPCADALELVPGYALDIPDDTVAALGIRAVEDLRILLVVQNWDDPERCALSAAGPIVYNTATGLAEQLMVPGAGRIRL
jgi:flagellar assembly factor FliW